MINTIGKAFEGIINNRLEIFLLETKQLNNIQFGFTKGKNTTDAIQKVLNHINTAKEEQKYIALVCLDIEGAFDNVWWTKILLQLRIKKIPKKIYMQIKSYFTNRTTIIRNTNDGTEISKKATKGCPQGTKISPLLWRILIDDLDKLETEQIKLQHSQTT